MDLHLVLSLPRDGRYVAVLRNLTEVLLGDLEVPEHAVDDVKIALSEACANAIRHAGVDSYSVAFTVDDRSCEVEVADLGPGFDAVQVQPAGTDLLEHGRGIPLIQALVDDLSFVREDDGMRVRLVKRWDALALGGQFTSA